MKCPNCEGVMPGSVAVCKACGHRLTQASVEKWRKERGTSAEAVAAPESPLAAKMRARFAEKQTAKSEANLIQFPVSPNAPRHAMGTAQAEPAWRNRVKASVQNHRERQPDHELSNASSAVAVASPTTDNLIAESGAAQLLLVESALKRIRRMPAPPAAKPVTVRVASAPINYPSAQSHALALMPEAERYAEAQRQVEEPLPFASAVSEITPTALPHHKTSVAESFKAHRLHKFTAAHLTLPLDEAVNDEVPDFAIEALPLTADTLPTLPEFQAELREDGSSYETSAARLRARAEFFAQVKPDQLEKEEITPWISDAEAALTQNKANVWLGQPAPLWLRTLAGICDIEAAAMLYLPFFGAYYTMEGTLNYTDYYIMGVMVVVVMFLYQLVTYTLNGRTFGMAIFGLRNFDVERANSRISFKRRLQQAFGGTVALLCPPFNFVVTRVTGFQRGFADALAKTVTLRRAQE